MKVGGYDSILFTSSSHQEMLSPRSLVPLGISTTDVCPSTMGSLIPAGERERGERRGKVNSGIIITCIAQGKGALSHTIRHICTYLPTRAHVCSHYRALQGACIPQGHTQHHITTAHYRQEGGHTYNNALQPSAPPVTCSHCMYIHVSKYTALSIYYSNKVLLAYPYMCKLSTYHGS